MRKFRMWLARQFRELSFWVRPSLSEEEARTELTKWLASDKRMQHVIKESNRIGDERALRSPKGDGGVAMQEVIDKKALTDHYTK